MSFTTLKDADVKTRKNHRCFGCGLDIPKGTVVHLQTNVDCGDIYTNYTHLHCQEICNWLCKQDPWGDGVDSNFMHNHEIPDDVLREYLSQVQIEEIYGKTGEQE